MSNDFEVSLGFWQDRPAEEVIDTALAADRLGYRVIWVGEMASWDAFALAAHVGRDFTNANLVIGPLAVTVRDPMMIAMGAASVASITGRRVDIALGTSSPVVVEKWHGRSRARPATALGESARAVRSLVNGEKTDLDGEVVRTHGYRLRLDAPGSDIVIAAFGDRAITAAARHADRLVLNLIDPATAADLIARLRAEADAIGRTPPRVAAWVTSAYEPTPAAIEQIRRAVVAYLAAPGYGEMFRRAGFGDLVDFARTGPHPGEVLARVPVELLETVGLVGDGDRITAGIAAYRDAGVDDIVLVPAATEDDPGGERTLAGFAELA